jgi:hypothetical protein
LPGLRLPGKGALSGEDARSPERRLWDSGLLPGRVSASLARSLERRAAFLTAAARGCLAHSDPTLQPGSLAQLGGRGVHSAEAPTLWLLGPQLAAPGSARAGGGCYAWNVRVSGSPMGSKRTTNNLSARRPPPPSASSRSPPGPRLPPGRRRCEPGVGLS